jgi:hypothetical protein
MTSNVLSRLPSIRMPSFYYDGAIEDYIEKFKDIKDADITKRIKKAVIPVLTLYKPFGRVHSIIRSVSSIKDNLSDSYTILAIKGIKNNKFALLKDSYNISMSMLSLTMIVFANTYFVFISNLNKVGKSFYKLVFVHKKDETYLDFIKKTLSMICSLLYLVAMVYGCLEIQVAALGLIVLNEMLSCLKEYKKGDYLQLSSNLIVTIFRTYQFIPKAETLKNKYIPNFENKEKISA